MQFLAAVHTDVGLRKKTNQDSVLLLQAETTAGPVLLASVCDGMGGLAKGEVASAAMVRLLAEWFTTVLPDLLAEGLTGEALRASWEALVQAVGKKISDYGSRIHADLGTTAVVFLVVGSTFYIMNVGDSRVYMLTDQIYQLTKDHTYVQREIDEGRMTYEQAMRDPQRSVLLQCIGASPEIRPDFFSGTILPGQVYLLCSDGFRHVLQPQEIYAALCPAVSVSEAAMTQNLIGLTETNKARKEEDNISALLIRTVS